MPAPEKEKELRALKRKAKQYIHPDTLLILRQWREAKARAAPKVVVEASTYYSGGGSNAGPAGN